MKLKVAGNCPHCTCLNPIDIESTGAIGDTDYGITCTVCRMEFVATVSFEINLVVKRIPVNLKKPAHVSR